MAAMTEIIDTLTAAIAGDQTLDAWSRINYDQGLSVLENCDPRDEPGPEDCPLVIVYPAAKSGGLSEPAKTHVIGISCAVYDDQLPETIQGVVRFTGGRMVEAMREMVVDVITAHMADTVHLMSIVTEYNTIEQFPYVSANMELVMTQEKTIGSDPFE